MDKAEYKRIMGLGTKDVGSRRLLLKEVLSYARKKGYRTADFYRMPKKQLFAIYRKYENAI